MPTIAVAHRQLAGVAHGQQDTSSIALRVTAAVDQQPAVEQHGPEPNIH